MSPTMHKQQGVVLMEVLIALLITAFGVLGYVGFQARTTMSQFEGYQRTQALMLINDMAERMSLNRSEAASYVLDDIGAGLPDNCAAPATRVATDLCEWADLIEGAAEVQGAAKVGAMINARACITNPAPNEYVISLVWQGIQASGRPVTDCGEDAFASEETRRAVSTRVHVADLGAV
jgi:type IV pilus assembly protein PilV